LTDRRTPRRASSSARLRRLTPAGLLFALLLMLGPGAADAGVSYKTGQYRGKTTQTSVTPSFRQIQFTVKKGKVKLTAEPTVARGLCLSAPVFTLDGTPTKKISGRGTFTFTHTFFGNKFDKISGAFVSPTEIEGFAIYHFQSQDLCSEGKTKVAFTARHK
jgi:hypothetical protein